MIMSADYMDIRREERQDVQNRIARRMLNHGDDEAYVREVTGLTQDQIDVILGRKQETA